MNIRRKNRLWIACGVLVGLALTITLVLYALRANIDLFYTPGEILYGVVVQGELGEKNHIQAKEVLAKHDENYTPPEVEKAMQDNHRRPESVYKDKTS